MGKAALALPPGDTSLEGNCLFPRLASQRRQRIRNLRVHQMDTRGPGPHLGLPLAPIDEYLQAVKRTSA